MQMIRVFAMPGADSGGNPAPVWLDADAMTSEQMQAHTRASGHESVFVLAPTLPLHRYRMRFFVPHHEMEMCGHATLAALWLLHQQGRWKGELVSVETLSGTVDGQRIDGTVEIRQPQAVVERVGDELTQAIARCLNVPLQQIAGPVLNSSTSRVKTLIPLPDLAALHGLAVDVPGVQALCDRLGTTGLYPFAVAHSAGPVVSARQFPVRRAMPRIRPPALLLPPWRGACANWAWPAMRPRS